MAATLLNLPSFCFTVVSFLEGQDVLNLRECSSALKELVDEESEAIFSSLLQLDFQIIVDGGYRRTSLRVQATGAGPSVFGTTGTNALIECVSSAECWKQWSKASDRYFEAANLKLNAPYFVRAAQIWGKLEAWFQRSEWVGLNIQASLQPGKSFQAVAGSHGLKMKPTLQAYQSIASFYSGQKPGERGDADLFGGYSAYEIIFSTRFTDGTFDAGLKLIATTPGRTCTFIDSETGHVKCINNGEFHHEQLACPSLTPDAVLVWFEEFARRLDTNYFAVGDLGDREISRWHRIGITQYPEYGQDVSRTITRGVEVTASAVYSPHTAVDGALFMYYFRIRLVQSHEDGYDASNEMCQLVSRHWRITHDGTTQSVDGDGVVGRYPLFFLGGYRNDVGRSSQHIIKGNVHENSVFRYKSCTQESDASGQFTGFMTFVPGSIDEPAGPPFSVNVDPFPLCPKPDFIY